MVDSARLRRRTDLAQAPRATHVIVMRAVTYGSTLGGSMSTPRINQHTTWYRIGGIEGVWGGVVRCWLRDIHAHT
jgi:hypothetical protein